MAMPTVLPTLNLNFAKSRKLDSRITFTRASTATYTGADGLIKTASVDEPRFHHDPTTGQSLGLLIEGARTNLLLQSADFTSASWNKTNTTVTANSTTAPDGTATADKLLETTANSTHTVGQNITATVSSTYVYSVFVKPDVRTKCTLTLGGAGQSPQESVTLDLSAGTATPGGSTTIYGIDPCANGWFRIWVGGVAEATTLAPFLSLLDASGASSYTGVATNGLWIWGAQCELVSMSSHIPTVAAAVTRSSDIALMTGSNFSSWFNATEGTFYASFISDQYLESATRRPFSVSESVGTPSNLMFFGNIGTIRQYVSATAGIQADQNQAINAAARNAAAISYKANEFRLSANGLAASTDSAGSLPAGLVLMAIGGDGTGGATTAINGTIERLAYIPKAITAAELQSLSTY